MEEEKIRALRDKKQILTLVSIDIWHKLNLWYNTKFCMLYHGINQSIDIWHKLNLWYNTKFCMLYHGINQSIDIWHKLNLWYNIKLFMLYHGINQSIGICIQQSFNGWLIEYDTISIPDNRPWFSTYLFFKLNNS